MGNSYDYRSGDDSRGVLDAFTAGYVSAMLFGSTFDPSDDGDDSSFLDNGYAWSDLTADSQEKVLASCKAFREAHAADIAVYGEDNAGADLWFTSNGDGCGFWENDHGTPEVCARLDAAGKRFKVPEVWFGEDEKIHVW